MSIRVVVPSNVGWRFIRKDVPDAQRKKFDDSRWDCIDTPHCFNATDTFDPVRGYYRGPAWYRRSLILGAHQPDSRVHLEVDAAFSVADIWLNGVAIGSYMGGYTGFVADLTHAVQWDGDNVLAIRVDNTHDYDVLPGKEVPDYNLYGGIYRDVRVLILPPVHLTQNGSLLTTDDVSHNRATLNASVEITNCSDSKSTVTTIEVVITAPGGKDVGRVTCDQQLEPSMTSEIILPSISVTNPDLWSPDSPSLYTATITLSIDGQIVDRHEEKFGIRWYTFDSERGFWLNGEQIKLNGINRHQDFPGLGNALPTTLQELDVDLIKEMGGNFVRCSHHPMHPEFLSACDQKGVLVYEEIASWQYIGGKKFADNAEAMMRQMIARDRNHPSIILWGLLNEGRDAELFNRLHRVAHGCDPTRLTIFADNRPEESEMLGILDIPDVYGLNYKVPHLDEIRSQFPDLAMLSSEHTNADGAIRGHLPSELSQAFRVDDDLSEFASRPWIAGSALWSMHDYGTDYEPVWPCQRSGIMDATRLPKETFFLLRVRWSPEPQVYIADHWTHIGFEGETRSVVVFSNCHEVELQLNGRSLGKQSKNLDPGESFILTWEVEFEAGTLLARGYHLGGEVEDTSITTGPPMALKLIASTDVVSSELREVSILTAQIVDESGLACPHYDGVVTFEMDGPGVLRGIGGRPEAIATGGMARIALQANGETGSITVSAATEIAAISPSQISSGLVEVAAL